MTRDLPAALRVRAAQTETRKGSRLDGPALVLLTHPVGHSMHARPSLLIWRPAGQRSHASTPLAATSLGSQDAQRERGGALRGSFWGEC